ncbi:MAG: hypothetical protein H6557_01620 [Lewinellaceae bacterium]|nr:hypothetical protein [Phaeodactylibacter sp.]MCB9035296.1 hypothetical protein [Lewinellaceae bacterium]
MRPLPIWYPTELSTVCAPLDKLSDGHLSLLAGLLPEQKVVPRAKKKVKPAEVSPAKSVFCNYIAKEVYVSVLKTGYAPPLSIVIDLSFIFLYGRYKEIEFSLPSSYPIDKTKGKEYCRLMNESLNDRNFIQVSFDYQRQRSALAKREKKEIVRPGDILNFVELVLFQWYEKAAIRNTLSQEYLVTAQDLSAYSFPETVSITSRNVDYSTLENIRSFLDAFLEAYGGDTSEPVLNLPDTQAAPVLALANEEAQALDFWLLQECSSYRPFEFLEGQENIYEYLSPLVVAVAAESSSTMPEGNRGVSRRGNLESSLRSQMVRPDFDLRFYLGKLLYYDRAVRQEEPRRVLLICLLNIGEDPGSPPRLLSEAKLLAAQIVEDITRTCSLFSALHHQTLLLLHNGALAGKFRATYTLISPEPRHRGAGLPTWENLEQPSWMLEQRKLLPFFFSCRPPWELEQLTNWRCSKEGAAAFDQPFENALAAIPKQAQFYNLTPNDRTQRAIDNTFLVSIESGGKPAMPDRHKASAAASHFLSHLSVSASINSIRHDEQALQWFGERTGRDDLEIAHDEVPGLRQRFDRVRERTWLDFANEIAVR